MKIPCDICTLVHKQYTPTAQFIHLSATHKISLLCHKCIHVAEDELFYIPITNNIHFGNQQEKYLNNISCNYEKPQCLNIKTIIQGLFQMQIWQPFRQLERTAMAYSTILKDYKKTVRSEYKALLSKLDPQILRNFKQIMTQIHQKPPALYKSSRVNVQKEQLDIIIRGMQISAQNEWSDLQNLLQITKKSYQKFKHVFINEKQQLDRKSVLLRKIISKINIQHQYKKKMKDNNSKKRNRINYENDQNEIVLISEQDEDDTSNGSKCSKNSRNSNKGSCNDDRKINNIDKNKVNCDINKIMNESQQYADDIGKKQIRYNNDKQSGIIFKRVRNKQFELIQIQQDSLPLNIQNTRNDNQQQNNKQQQKKNQIYYKNNKKIGYKENIQDQQQFKQIILEPLQQTIKQSISQQSNKQPIQQIRKQSIIQIQREPIIQKQREPINIQQEQQINVDQYQQKQKQPQQIIIQQNNLNNYHNNNNYNILSPLSSIKSVHNNYNLKNTILQSSNTINNHSNIKPIINQHPLPSTSFIINQYQYFEINVDNYPYPLQSLKSKLISNPKIKKQLQSNNISLINLLNQSNTNDYRPYLKLIRKLKISYTRKQNLNQLLKFIPDINNLQELTICEPLLATQQIITFIIMSLPKLKSLQFLCYNELNQQHLSLITQYLPSIQQLYYGPKCYNNIALKSQYRQFRQHNKRKRTNSLNNSSLKIFLKQTPYIKNIWISQKQQIQDIFNFITQFKPNIQHLIIGKYNPQQTLSLKLSSECWNSILKLTQLYSIALINIQIDEKSFGKIIMNNSQTLKSLEIYSCANWTDDLASKLSKCRTLREFYLFGSDQSIFKGAALWQVTSLETLVLRTCQFMDYNAAQRKIGKLSQLRHVDFYGCQWFNDMVLKELVKNKYITYLNLANTEIGSLFYDYLSQLLKIRCIALGSTRINAAAIQDLCTSFPEIQKLSLYNLCGSPVVNGRCLVKKNRLNKIGDILKGLKYLDVGSLDRADDSLFDHFKKLKSIYLWMSIGISNKKIVQMQEKGINIVNCP